MVLPAASRPPRPNESAIATAADPSVSPKANLTISSPIPIVDKEIAKKIPSVTNRTIEANQELFSVFERASSNRLIDQTIAAPASTLLLASG